MINVAILGFGTVGSGVADVLTMNAASIAKRVGQAVNLKYILDVRDFPDSPYQGCFVKDFAVIEADPEVDVVVETIGGARIALEFTQRALKAGKSVVSSNKELVATHGYDLLQLAKANGVSYLFEASVGGGIPILRPLGNCLAANEIEHVTGILNGTTNYILTRMIRAGLTFEQALKEAQDNGYAEKDPTADVEGIDAVRKISILNNLSFGFGVDPEQIHTEGITHITLEDVAYAANYDCVIKLLGTAELLPDGKVYILVSPALVHNTSMLAKVDDVLNAVLIHGDNVGDVMFYGPGAGKLPTASAVVGDIVDCANHKDERRELNWGALNMDRVADYREIPNKYYIRLKVTDTENVQHEVRSAFGNIYLLARSGAYNEELAFITDSLTENDVRARLDSLNSVVVKSMIRVATC